MNTLRHTDTKHNPKPYTLPEEETATCVAEAVATSQYYPEDSTMEICIPAKDISLATEMFNRMGWIVVKKNRDDAQTLQEKFNTLYDAWWKETCTYSGPNLCYNNDSFRLIKNMGQAVLPLIEQKKSTTPSYMHRHLDWLKKGILS